MNRPFHNRQWRDSAKGQECQGRFNNCLWSPDTVVLCHIRRPGTGTAIKPADYKAAYLCANCHAEQEARQVPWEWVLDAVFRTLDIHHAEGRLVTEYASEGVQ